MNIAKQFYDKFLKYKPTNEYSFSISNATNEDIENDPVSPAKDLEPQKISKNLDENMNFLKSKYNSLICNDVIIRDFILIAQNKEYKASIIYIDGLVDSKSITDSILHPLMLRNRANTYTTPQKEIVSEFTNNDVIIRKIKKFNLENYIFNHLIPENSVEKFEDFSSVLSGINMGDCLLLVDTINIAFDIDVKGFKQRSIDSPQNEIVIRGSQEAFVESYRTNTSMIRRIVNNENLVIENCSVGKITKTKVAVCYLKDITNNDLVAEVKYRINNLDIDHLLSSGQLEQLIQDDGNSLFPQMLATERPDKACVHLLEGRVVVLVNGTPYALIMPGVLSDFLSSPEDENFKYQFSNMLKFIRGLAIFFALLLPGIYVAITNYHTELLPTELLYTIEAARETVPFPTIIEILLMEISFELIREAGLRVPSPIGPTIRNCWRTYFR